MAWPPTLDELKTDLEIPLNDQRKDAALTLVLNAAVSSVQRWRKGDYAFDPLDPATFSKPDPALDGDLVLGTLRLAGRWHARRRSQDGMVNMGDLGVGRISTGDNDIDRMLRIGRHQKAKVG